MCGIVGFLDTTMSFSNQEGRELMEIMASRLRHRGPDDAGAWSDAAAGIFMGHRRLSIQDLSIHGHQPMRSRDGRWTLVFNGEIYNFSTLRQELEHRGLQFRGHSDTEVLLELIALDGPERAIRAARGMFAIAAWDGRDRVLHLARDRMGEKPLYYGWLGESFVFGSELRALHPHPAWTGRIDRLALTDYLRYICVPAPQSIFEGIRKLEPGQLLSVSAAERELSIRPFWDADRLFAEAMQNPWSESPEAYLERLEEVLGDAVSEQMVADVPLGAFLSGGVDSSLIVAMMQARSPRPVQTFTIGFGEAGFDESGYARRVAQVLGTEHVEERLSGADALERVPSLQGCYDEPFADSSGLPTMLVSMVARRNVTVSLSGDGGDELFGGYSRYPESLHRWQTLQKTPFGIRRLAGGLVSHLPEPMLSGAGRVARAVLRKRVPADGVTDRIRYKARGWGASGLPGVYLRSMSLWDQPGSVVIGGGDGNNLEARLGELGVAETDPVRWMMYRDARMYLPDDILTKVDRAAMHYSLESRIPLLDHRVVELAWRAPTALCFRDGQGKWPLRALLQRHLPADLIDRPKMGFAVPLAEWLRGPLLGWAEELLDPVRLAQEGWFRPQPILRRWNDLKAGGDTHEMPIWSILMFQAWKEYWGEHIAT